MAVSAPPEISTADNGATFGAVELPAARPGDWVLYELPNKTAPVPALVRRVSGEGKLCLSYLTLANGSLMKADNVLHRDHPSQHEVSRRNFGWWTTLPGREEANRQADALRGAVADLTAELRRLSKDVEALKSKTKKPAE